MRRPRLRKRAQAILEGLQAALAYTQGRPPKGMTIVTFHRRKGKWVQRKRVIK